MDGSRWQIAKVHSQERYNRYVMRIKSSVERERERERERA
jgi:hypothetical protein